MRLGPLKKIMLLTAGCHVFGIVPSYPTIKNVSSYLDAPTSATAISTVFQKLLASRGFSKASEAREGGTE
jgi:hypothetical protein